MLARLTFLIPVWRQIQLLLLKVKSSEQAIFTMIYKKKGWGGGSNASFSGRGSDLSETEVIRKALPALIDELHWQSFLDAACGDFFWMKTLDMPVEYSWWRYCR